MLPVLRSTAMCNLRQARCFGGLRWFQHESSSPCYRSSGGLVDCLRLSQSAASCGAASTADTTSSSPGSRYRAREARRSSARSLRFGGRQACTPSGQPGPFQSPSLNRPVDRQAYRSCRPSSSRLPPRQTQTVKSPRRRSPSLYSAQLETWYFFCFACLYWQRLGYFMLEHTSATTIGGFRSQPERCNNATFTCQSYDALPAALRRAPTDDCSCRQDRQAAFPREALVASPSVPETASDRRWSG